MKPVAICVLLIFLSFVWPASTKAQIFRGPDSERLAEKASKKYQKEQRKALKKQQKAAKKNANAQRKAAKKAQQRHS